MKFSVLMSIYYKESPKALNECLISILKEQTLLPNEVVLVEDGPLTEELNKIINDYLKKYPKIIKLYPLKENKGLGYALQYGLTKCENDLIMRMDTDDVAVPNRFQLQVDYMKKHKDVAVVGGYIAEFNESIDEDKRLKKMPLTYNEVKEYAKFRNPLNHMSVCFRKKDVLEVGNYQPLLLLEDHYLWARMLANGKKIENIPYVLVYARIGNGFYDRRGNKNYLKGWKFLQKYLYDNKLINFSEKCRNMLGMRIMIYMPSFIRKFLYNHILRDKENV